VKLIDVVNLTKNFGKPGSSSAHTALENVSFSVRSGECVGLIGRNGSGKTTLLRILARITKPSLGEAKTKGSFATLLEPGSGIELDASGRENLRNLFLLQRVDVSQLPALLERACRFADLGSFLDRSVRTYSTGMVMRLAFASVISLPADLLLVDEVLAVGDPVFQRKCANEIRHFVRGGGTMVLASHNYHEVAALCERVIFLDRGRIIVDGPADSVFRAFWARNETDLMTITAEGDLPFDLLKAHTPLAETTGEMEIIAVRFRNGTGEVSDSIQSLGRLCIEIDYNAKSAVDSPLCRVQFHRGDGLFVMGSNTLRHELDLGILKGKGTIRLTYGSLPLGEGDFFVSVGLWPDEYRSFIAERAYDYKENAYVLQVKQNRQHGGGLIASDHSWEWS